MASKTDIANQALIKLGVDEITNIEDADSSVAVKLNIVFDDLLDETLQEASWNFSLASAELARLVETPIADYNYYYKVPIDSLQVLKVLNTSGNNWSYNQDYKTEYHSNWRIEGSKLLSNDETIKISYIRRVTNMQELSSLFRAYFISRLAYEMCYTLTLSVSKQDRLEKEYMLKLDKAKKAEASEIGIKTTFSSTLIDRRFTVGSSNNRLY